MNTKITIDLSTLGIEEVLILYMIHHDKKPLKNSVTCCDSILYGLSEYLPSNKSAEFDGINLVDYDESSEVYNLTWRGLNEFFKVCKNSYGRIDSVFKVKPVTKKITAYEAL